MHIYVSNLAITTTAQDLRQLFEPYGVVAAVRIITDRDTGRCKGFGFVEMSDSQAAHAAIVGLRGQDFVGRALTVNEAKAQGARREPRQAHG